MEANRRKTFVEFLAAFFLILLSLQFASAQEYDAMKGVNNANVIFDMRDRIPKSAVVHMKLLHDTYKQLVAMKKNPAFVVVFMGSAVKLISSNRAEFSPEDQESLKEIGDIITKMSKDGIDFEVCLFAAKVFGVDPASIQSEVLELNDISRWFHKNLPIKSYNIRNHNVTHLCNAKEET